VIEWASEEIRIPYVHPITGKKTSYVPDFLIRYRDKNNKITTELIEIKPYNQSILTEKANTNLRATVAVNHAKWNQARRWCANQGIKFRIVTEREMFHQ
jgi:hypothetical protein